MHDVPNYETKADALEASFDVLAQADAQDERMTRMEGELAALKNQAVAAQRPALDGAKGSIIDPARAAFVDRYLRHGQEMGVELKSFSGATSAAGGYAVPREIDAQIEMLLKAISPIRSIANVVKTGTAGYRKLVTSGGVVSGWAAETAVRPETATPVFSEIVPPSGELYANPSASQAMLDDAQFDVEGWLAGEIAMEFAKAEGSAFISGNGTAKPKGFLTYPVTSELDTIRAFGTLQYVPSGAAGNFLASNPADKLVDLIQALKAPYRQGASFVMNSATLARIRKFKTADGAFMWQPSMVAEQPATLLGYPVIEAEDMPDVATDSLSIAFGNFNHGYVIAERNETSILRDPFSNKPFVNFYAVKRIGTASDDAALGGLAASAIAHAEDFCGLIVFARAGTEILTACAEWTRMVATPMRSVGQVVGLPAESASFTLPAGAAHFDYDGTGDAFVRVSEPGSAGRIQVPFVAGLADDWPGCPDALRQGIVRLIAHLFTERESDTPPAAVVALWRPWRRMRIA